MEECGGIPRIVPEVVGSQARWICRAIEKVFGRLCCPLTIRAEVVVGSTDKLLIGFEPTTMSREELAKSRAGDAWQEGDVGIDERRSRL